MARAIRETTLSLVRTFSRITGESPENRRRIARESLESAGESAETDQGHVTDTRESPIQRRRKTRRHGPPRCLAPDSDVSGRELATVVGTRGAYKTGPPFAGASWDS